LKYYATATSTSVAREDTSRNTSNCTAHECAQWCFIETVMQFAARLANAPVRLCGHLEMRASHAQANLRVARLKDSNPLARGCPFCFWTSRARYQRTSNACSDYSNSYRLGRRYDCDRRCMCSFGYSSTPTGLALPVSVNGTVWNAGTANTGWLDFDGIGNLTSFNFGNKCNAGKRGNLFGQFGHQWMDCWPGSEWFCLQHSGIQRDFLRQCELLARQRA